MTAAPRLLGEETETGARARSRSEDCIVEVKVKEKRRESWGKEERESNGKR